MRYTFSSFNVRVKAEALYIANAGDLSPHPFFRPWMTTVMIPWRTFTANLWSFPFTAHFLQDEASSLDDFEEDLKAGYFTAGKATPNVCVCVCVRVCLQLRVSFCVRRLRLVGWRPGFTRRFSYFTLKLSSWSLLLCWRSLPIHLQKCPGTQRSRSSCCTRHFCCLFIVGVLILDLFGLWQAFIPPADPVHEHFSEVPLWHEVLRNFFLNLVLPVRWRIRCPLKTLDRRARRFICFCCCSMGGASAVSVSSLDLYEWLQ